MDGIMGVEPQSGPESSAQIGVSVEVLVEGEGITVVEAITIRHGSCLREIVKVVAFKGGYEHTEAHLFLEDEGEPLDLAIVVDAAYPHHRKHHVHRVREVDVAVHYGSSTHERRFPPSAKVETVLMWAVKAFAIDSAMATEFELALVGSSDELAGTTHIGTLLKHPACRLEFDLVRGVIPNGGGA